MRIGVIGRGHVGQNVVAQFESRATVVSYDRNDDVPYPADELAGCSFVLICVDTPMDTDGSLNVDNVESAIAQVPCETIVIRSTVPPGTTDRLAAKLGKNICFWPEYVGETDFAGASWETFSAARPFVILGGEPELRRWFIDQLEPVLGPNVTFHQTTAAEAELVKFMENSYFAAKVIFVNQFRELSEKLGLDWTTVREGWLLDPRIERDHTSAFADARGYGGKCLPKDVSGILAFAKSEGVDLSMLAAVQDANQRYLSSRPVS